MQHCCNFKPDDIYYLRDNDLYNFRRMAIGFCPICHKPVCEISEWRFDGVRNLIKEVGIQANDLMLSHKYEIVYSMKDSNYSKFKAKPFGWKYGINKDVKIGKKIAIRQYACDFYGNKELVKSL